MKSCFAGVLERLEELLRGGWLPQSTKSAARREASKGSTENSGGEGQGGRRCWRAGFFSLGKISKKACEDFSDGAGFFVFGREGGFSRLGFCFANGLSILREGRIEIVDGRSAGLSGFGAGSGGG